MLRFYKDGRLDARGRRSRSSVDAQVVVYGCTPGGIMAAIEASRNGATVSLVGGWRERNAGGMVSGGLSATDVSMFSIVTGLSRTFFTDVNAILGRSDTPLSITNTAYPPRVAQQAFEAMLAAQGIVPYWTDGVDVVRKCGTRIGGFTTVDGQAFTGKVFIDASYEGDLMARSGVSYRVGRDAKDGTHDSGDGYFGPSGNANADYFFGVGNQIQVDPYVTPGDGTSGLLPGITPPPYPAVGSADNNVQAMAFRLTLNNYAFGGSPGANFIPMPSVPPVGYVKQNYELFLRYCGQMTALGNTFQTSGATGWRVATHLLINSLGSAENDCNQAGPPSTDFLALGPYDATRGYMLGGASEYVEAPYCRREQVWKNHENWARGWFYVVQHETDGRIPDPMRQAFLTYGFDAREYLNPHPNDAAGWPYCLYVRAGRRMLGDFVYRTDDLRMADGTTPRSTNTIAQGSYTLDCHAVSQVVSSGYVRTEGAFNSGNAGGLDQIFPIPYEITRPARADCSNLLVTFCVSTSSEVYAAIRLEVPSMQMGQAAGCAAAIAAKAAVQPDIQDVDYPTLRAQLLSEGMVLPQVN